MGICLGMQLFGHNSEETSHSEEGFNWINGKLTKFKVKKKIPHIGFNNLINLNEPELFKNISKKNLNFILFTAIILKQKINQM